MSVVNTTSKTKNIDIDTNQYTILYKKRLNSLTYEYKKKCIISLFMGYHKRLGEKCIFKNFMSKDLMRWFCTNYLFNEEYTNIKFKTLNLKLQNGTPIRFEKIYGFNMKGSYDIFQIKEGKPVFKFVNYSNIILQTPLIEKLLLSNRTALRNMNVNVNDAYVDGDDVSYGFMLYLNDESKYFVDNVLFLQKTFAEQFLTEGELRNRGYRDHKLFHDGENNSKYIKINAKVTNESTFVYKGKNVDKKDIFKKSFENKNAKALLHAYGFYINQRSPVTYLTFRIKKLEFFDPPGYFDNDEFAFGNEED